MANKYFTQLTQLAAGSVASGDAWAIEDISAGETKYITSTDAATYFSSALGAASGGWDAVADTWTYLGAGTVAIPAGGTLLYGKGDKIKFVQGGTQLYFYATAVGGTTLAITGGSDYTLGTSAISSVYYSKIENPYGFPDWFNWTVTHTGFSANPSYVAKFKISGKSCLLSYTRVGNGTSNATNYLVSIPVTAATVANAVWMNAMPAATDNGSNQAPGFVQILSAGTTAELLRAAAAAWTSSGAKGAFFQISYEI